MKTRELSRPSAFLTGVAVLFFSISVASPVSAQDKKQQKVTTVVTATPGKNDKEQKVTVYASSDPKEKDGKMKVHIIKEENGKRTEVDTVINVPDGIEGAVLENLMKNVNVQVEKADRNMKQAEDQMKTIEIYMNGMSDSVAGDSTGKHKYTYKFRMPDCGNFHPGNSPHAFSYNFEMPDIPGPPDAEEELENEFFNHSAGSPGVFAMPGRGESLSDVLGNIPMSRVKSYKIIDKKGGKRIIIDVQDGNDFGGSNVIYINGRHAHARPPRGAGNQKEMKVIIQSGDDNGSAGKPGTPAPPAEPGKQETNTPKI